MTTTLRPTGPERAEADGGRARDYDVCVNGRPVGRVSLGTDERGGPGAGRIRALRIDEADRHRGRATVAALAAEEVLRGWGCRSVGVTVPAAAAAALGLATALGYTEAGRAMSKALTDPPELAPEYAVRPITGAGYAAWLAESVASSVAQRTAAGTPLDAARRAVDRSVRVQLPQGAATPGTALRTLDHAGVPVGSLWVALRRPHEPGGWVFDVVVHPPYRGRGHGRALLLLAERECLAAGLDRLGLHVVAGNTPALRLYESLGYTPTEFRLAKPLL
ncbi:Acetyltransferase YpeA [Streptomyces sp. RB5]|uniref:Acetyltransferase YpeA n=1 Tax=Streptomyces smaragdinus TaxID=2585196 RepID=A0A7K0CEP3_9ACTN|nr:GNAT family N-acetyltransferase [Streptomyces smaragdinus]MQY11940.1 Acetyltransferase YpeA [Streptomyces smaragdinus]